MIIRFPLTLALMVSTWAAANFYSPLLLKLYPVLLYGLPLLILFTLWLERARKPLIPLVNYALAVAVFGILMFSIAQFQDAKYSVRKADPAHLETLGRHLVIGYRDFDEIRNLVEKGGVGGVFITRRNVVGKSIEDVQRDIAQLQKIQREHGRPPLWIAADQEGGIVAHLSPPLSEMPALSTMVNDKGVDIEGIKAYATTQGQELQQIGVNLNLAPVVDLRNAEPLFDRHSLIAQRALSDNPLKVAEAAQQYVLTLATFGITATLKHFPGLGRITADTHFFSAELSESPAELAKTDWLPFRQVLANTNAAMMLGHVILPTFDATRPASYAKGVISDLIRGEWQHDGLLISDDFAMGPVYYSQSGAGGAAVEALNAGLDLILIAYDERQYYPVMAALLAANERGELDHTMLQKSAARMAEKVVSGNLGKRL